MLPIMARVIGMTHSSRIQFQNQKGDYRGYMCFLVRIFKLHVRFLRAAEGLWLPGRAQRRFLGEGARFQHRPGWDHQCCSFRVHRSGL